MNLSTAKLRGTAHRNTLLFRRPLTTIVFAAALIGLAACGASDKPVAEQKADAKTGEHPEKGGLKLSPEEVQRAGIKLETLKLDAVNDAITVTATIRPNQDRIARVAPRVDGRVTGVSANLGDQVRTGQTLAILDSLSLGEASSALIQAQSAYRIADADFKRAEALNADEIIPQKEFLRAKSEREKAAAGLRAAEDKVRLLGVPPKHEGKVESNFPVMAPFAGTVIQKKATLGELASPNEPLFTVADLSRVWIEANLGEAMLAKVRLGAKATVTVSAYPGERFTGRVTYIANVLDKDSRTMPARIEVENKDGRLKLEMFATATIDTASASAEPKREAITVPDASVVLMQGQPTVFVFEHGGYEQRAIELGEKLSGRTVVKSGLAAGDQLVAAGSYALKARLLKSQISDEH